MATTKTNTNSKPSEMQSNHSPLEKLFVSQLKDVYYAEQQLIKALQTMRTSSTTEELEDAFELHMKQTERQVTRLEKVFALLGIPAEQKKCDAIEGLIKESQELTKETKERSATRDAALIIAAQKIEHYEIATYGSLVQLAKTMDLNMVASLLEKTLMEEESTDRKLTQIAETSINVDAENEGHYSWQQ